MTSEFLAPSILGRLGDLFSGLRHNPASSRRNATPDDLRAERDFLNEVIWTNPYAFSSELDVQHMMLIYPDRT